MRARPSVLCPEQQGAWVGLGGVGRVGGGAHPLARDGVVVVGLGPGVAACPELELGAVGGAGGERDAYAAP